MSKSALPVIVLAVITLFASACAAAGEPNAFAMNKLIGRGINIGGALDTPKTEGEWGITLQDEYFQIIKDAGFNSIRLAVRWNAHAENKPPYTIDPNFFKRVDWAVNNCLSRNLPVVLFTHHYEELYGDPDGQKDRFLAIWKQIAERYKDYPDALVFEPLSERVDKLNAANWNSLTKEALTIIRRSNPHRTVVIGPGGFYLIDNLELLELPKEDSNIIVDVHYFMPSEFTHQGATWVQDSEKWLGTKWTGSEKEMQTIIKNFDIAAEWAKKNNRPIYLSEFGTYEKADMESRARWTKFVADAATARGFSISYWEFCSVFGMYDLQTKSWRKELLDAVIAPNKLPTNTTKLTPDPASSKNYAEADPFKINKQLGKGINIGNALEAPNEGEWGVTLQEEYFQLIKEAGFNSIRLPVCWSAHAMNEKPYTIDPNFFKRVDWAVNNCLSRNLLIMLNVHHYRELSAYPAGNMERFLAIWKQIAERYKDYPDALVFELLNEPEQALVAAEWNAMLAKTLAVIRESNPRRTIVIGPVNYNDIQQLRFLELPGDDRNIIVTVHYYLPHQFTHQGVDWVPAIFSKSWLGTKWTGTDVEKKMVREDFNVAAAWAKENNRPIYLGEFGTYEKADMESRVCWTKFIADTTIERGFSFAYWEFCAGFGLYDLQTKSWHKELLEALIPPKK